jgi:hypothetical protein
MHDMRTTLFRLVGYDPAVTRNLSSGDLAHLAWSGALVLMSALLYACGGSYLVYLGVNAGAILPAVVALSFVAVFLFALNMQRMFVTSGGYGYHSNVLTGRTWRPDSLRLVCVLFLALLFAQPLMLLAQHRWIEPHLKEKVDTATARYRSNQLAALDRKRDELLKAGNRTSLLNERLGELARQRDGVERKVGTYRNSLQKSGMVRERWQAAWANPWGSAALIFLSVLLLTAGDLLRDLRPGALRRYELERAALARDMIERAFGAARARVRVTLDAFGSAALPGPRWHEMDSYFDMHIAATAVHTPPFESHGSAEDLLDRLEWQAADGEKTP